MVGAVGPLRILAGLVALGLLLAVTLGATAMLFTVDGAVPASGGGGVWLRPQDIAALRFTVLQSALSAGVSVALAIPLARALARRRFAGRQLLVTLLGAPFLLPSLVAAFGILAVWGRSGWVSEMLATVGRGPVDIYGLGGVVLAHVFFNLPLATRLILQGWLAIPSESFRLAAVLGLPPGAVFRHLEWPMLRGVVPGAVLLIFLLCSTSFAIVLALGGGPAASSLELAIYEAVRFEFDLARAARLALVQFAVCGLGLLAVLAAGRQTEFGGGLGGVVARWDADGRWLRAQDGAVICLLVAFLGAPLVAVGLRGFAGLALVDPAGAGRAAAVSLGVAAISSLLAAVLALAIAALADGLAAAGARRGSQVLAGAGYLALAASPFVTGTGLFVLLYPLADPGVLALPVTAVVNAAVSLPFALAVLVPAFAAARARYGRLADSLGLSGMARARLMYGPLLRRPLGFATGLAAAFSMGDLGVIALFASSDQATLPLYMYRLMAAYRMEAAGGVALLLAVLTLAVFWLCDRGGRLGSEV